MKRSLLIVDDDPRVRTSLVSALTDDDTTVLAAEDAESALAALDKGPIGVVLSDVKMPGMSGLDLLKMLKKRAPDLDVILMTAYGVITCYDVKTGEMTFVNAGHCYPVLLRNNGEVERLVKGGAVVGMLSELTLEVGKTTLEQGDVLVLYTDGLTESLDAKEYKWEDAVSLVFAFGYNRGSNTFNVAVERAFESEQTNSNVNPMLNPFASG